MGESTTLGDFLRTRRGRLTPSDVGIRSYGERRVPGLRREELAQLAGVSAAYYTRLEQGQSHQASRSVLDSIADALRLSIAERAHLHRLSCAAPPAPRPRVFPSAVRPGTRQLLAALDDVPALLLGIRTEILAWNTLGHELFASHLDPAAPDREEGRPHLISMLFLDDHYRALHRDLEKVTSCAVAALRIAAGEYPGDPGISALVGELSVRSDHFAELWAAHPVAAHSYGTRRLHHPEVGDLELEQENVTLGDGSGQVLMLHSAAPDSSSHHALQLLRMRTADRPPRASSKPWPYATK